MPIRRKGHAKAVENEGASEQESDMKIDRAEEDENGGQRAGKARRSTANAGNAAPAPPLEPPPPFDPKSFHHQPIPAAHHPKMKAISDSWDIPKGPLDLLAQLVRESAVLLTDADEEANATVRAAPSIRLTAKTRINTISFMVPCGGTTDFENAG